MLRLFQHFFQYVNGTVDDYVLKLGVFYLLHHFPAKFYHSLFEYEEFVRFEYAPVIRSRPQMVQKYPMLLWILNLQQSMATDQAIRSLVQYRENFPLEIDYDLIEYLAVVSNTSIVNKLETTLFDAIFFIFSTRREFSKREF